MTPDLISIRSTLPVTPTVLRLLDLTAVAVGLALAGRYFEPVTGNQTAVALGAAFVTVTVLSEFTGNYRNWRGASLWSEWGHALMTWGLTLALLAAAGTVMRITHGRIRFSFAPWALLTSGWMIGFRMLLRYVQTWIRARGFATRGYAIVGVTNIGIRLADSIEASSGLGLKLHGFYDDRPKSRTDALPARFGERLGSLRELVQAAQEGTVSTIYITLPMRAEGRIREALDRLSDSTASVYIVPDFFVFQLLHSRWNTIEGVPVVSVFENPFYGVDGFLKRSLDVLFATVILATLSIPMLIIATAVKATSPGPVFFRQKRYGLDGKEILVWKFRSMTVCDNGPEIAQATKNDARITPLGGVLRKTSLDELPQLFNVISGEMSLVGPRPHASAHNEEYRTLIDGYMLRHKVKPGITGLAQVNGWRGETDTLEKMERRVECDHQYIRQWTPWLDIKILFRTIFTVLSAKNAY